ncbi:MAG: hypothetical protein M0R50_03145 [Candidatus Cloacimonetes bacterium]|jgi:hypothetical protein|nr:hypothetical protein [Candidatus Cloacimonadota bacterium]
MIPLDVLQNHLILISHHVEDAFEALEDGDDSVVEASLRDINEIVDELKDYFPEDLALEVEAKEMGMDSRVEEIADDM